MSRPRVLKIPDLGNINYENIDLARPFKEINNTYFAEITSEKYLIQTNITKNLSSIYNYNNSLYIDIKIDNNQLIQHVINMDKKLKDKVSNNFFTWFGKTVSKKHISEFYINSIVTQEDEPYVTFEIPSYNNKEDIIIWNKKNEKINIDKIEENMDMILVIESKGIRLERNKIYTVWEIQQIKVYYDEKSIYNEYLIEDDVDSMFDIENMPNPLDDDIISNDIIATEENEVSEDKTSDIKTNFSDKNSDTTQLVNNQWGENKLSESDRFEIINSINNNILDNDEIEEIKEDEIKDIKDDEIEDDEIDNQTRFE